MYNMDETTVARRDQDLTTHLWVVRPFEAQLSGQHPRGEDYGIERVAGVRREQVVSVDLGVESHVHPGELDLLGEVSQSLVELLLPGDQLGHVELQD